MSKTKAKWKQLTPEQLETLADEIESVAADKKFERKILIEEHGFDLVDALEAVAARLSREAARRERKATEVTGR